MLNGTDIFIWLHTQKDAISKQLMEQVYLYDCTHHKTQYPDGAIQTQHLWQEDLITENNAASVFWIIKGL